MRDEVTDCGFSSDEEEVAVFHRYHWLRGNRFQG